MLNISMGKKLSTEEFINRAKQIHGDKYDYSETIYTKYHDKVKIICKTHGVFFQTVTRHFNNGQCPVCRKERYKNEHTLTTQQFIERSKKKYGDKYDYSKTEYVSYHSTKKIIFICKKHGEFGQSAQVHLNNGQCPICVREKAQKLFSSNTKDFIKKAKQIHGDKYDYSKTEYVNARSGVIITCKIHGDFNIRPNNHISSKNGCGLCGIITTSNSKRKTTEDFIEKAKQIHGDKYDYSETVYESCFAKLKIKCKTHGFFYQQPNNHLVGKGCFKCRNSIGENKIELFLTNNNIDFIREYKFDKCRYIRPLKFDFYLPKYNMCIEFDGNQHFNTVYSWNGHRIDEKTAKNNLSLSIIRDNIKTDYCKNNNIRLIRISYKNDINEKLKEVFNV